MDACYFLESISLLDACVGLVLFLWGFFYFKLICSRENQLSACCLPSSVAVVGYCCVVLVTRKLFKYGPEYLTQVTAGIRQLLFYFCNTLVSDW